MTIFYRLENKLYINITNACPCDCVFCIRNLTDTVGDANTLWLPHEPSLTEIKKAFDARQDLHEVNEIVFCGYGEPMTRADNVIEVTEYIKTKTSLPVRINTNGLVELLHPSLDIAKLSVIDSISVSLNADDALEYLRITRSSFGIESFDALLDFVKEAKNYTAVTLTVMENLGTERIDNCKRIASEFGATLRVRRFM